MLCLVVNIAILQKIQWAKKNLKIILGKYMNTLLDNCTTAVACKSLGIDFVGCELEPDYVEIANNRLKCIQPDMFGI